MNKVHDLPRFIIAQEPVYETVLDELRSGRKRSHWMWFIFPQIAGLGHSAMAQRYAMSSLEEARAYLAHPILGARLRTCTDLVAGIEGRTIADIFGHPDDLKFFSCMTLFDRTEENSIFGLCLDKYFAGGRDAATLARLGSDTNSTRRN